MTSKLIGLGMERTRTKIQQGLLSKRLFRLHCPVIGLSECWKEVKKSFENPGIRAGFPGTARQGRCAVQSAGFILKNKPEKYLLNNSGEDTAIDYIYQKQDRDGRWALEYD